MVCWRENRAFSVQYCY